jgi:hypothetical protein
MVNSKGTGHAENVANFATLRLRCSGFGEAYNPSNTVISIANLNLVYTQAQNSIDNLNQVLPTFNSARDQRSKAFDRIPLLVSKISGSLKSLGQVTKVTENALTIVRKIQGRRVSAKLTDDELKALATDGKKVRQVSTAQTSFDNQIDNLGRLISQLSAIPEYKPNEKDLQVASLTEFLNDLKAKNLAVISTSSPVDNARIVRNEILYKAETGLIDISLAVKNYVKSVFGPSSPYYKQISGLKFNRYK